MKIETDKIYELEEKGGTQEVVVTRVSEVLKRFEDGEPVPYEPRARYIEYATKWDGYGVMPVHTKTDLVEDFTEKATPLNETPEYVENPDE